MAKLLKRLAPEISKYRDRQFRGDQEEFERCLQTSTTVYVGNLSFYTSEDQINEVFSMCGPIRRIVMGLDKMKKTPCGFCFVIYHSRADTEDCVKYINGTVLDDRPIRVDFDWGFQEGRQFGRGRSGGQVRDEYRMDWDAGRGGYGQVFRSELATRMADQMGQYAEGQDEDGALNAANVKRRTEPVGVADSEAANPRFREDIVGSDEEDAA